MGQACAEDTSRPEAFTLDAGETAILLGTDTGPNPAEFLLHALAACVTTSLVYSAAARGPRGSPCDWGTDVTGSLGDGRVTGIQARDGAARRGGGGEGGMISDRAFLTPRPGPRPPAPR